MSLLILVEKDDLREAIKGSIKSLNHFNEIHEAVTIEEALNISNNHAIDMFIIDMSISIGKGSEFVEELRRNDDYKFTWAIVLGDCKEECSEILDCYNANICNRFILKPVEISNIGDVVSELLSKKVIDASEENRLRIKRKSMDYFFDHDDIVFIETVEKMAYIYTVDEKHKIGRITLNELEERLGNKKFLRVHRSYIINTDYIDYIKKQNNQNQIKIKYYKHMIPVGRTYRNVLGLV